jgi:hypothetical protein
VPSVRYFGPGTACDVAEKVIGTITDAGAVPSDLNLGGNYEPTLVVEVLRHLARYWAPVPPSRNEERRRSFARINIVHDFDEILAIIAGDPRDATDLSFDQHIETWTVENESENGYGAVIPPRTSRCARTSATICWSRSSWWKAARISTWRNSG